MSSWIIGRLLRLEMRMSTAIKTYHYHKKYLTIKFRLYTYTVGIPNLLTIIAL